MRAIVVSYTNHALEWLVEDPVDIGIVEYCMVRLGSKSTMRTEKLRLVNEGRQSNC